MGSLEAEVLAHLWASADAMVPAEVRQAMADPPAYTTVMTILTRLWQKGLVERESRGRAFAYRPLVSEADLAAQRMRATLQATTDREAALSRFVSALSRREERALRKILDDLGPER
ncbi:MAG: BlaI/MecI/CopY family transcriptional regulator [Actinomycetota bacterium]|nr:BlaI/MecI/CopY family transcriptional regulator [Actinomycetota bacterium]